MSSGYLGTLENDFRFVTWGKETSLTDEFVNGGLLEEAWVVVWPENMGTKQFQDGMNVDALKAAYESLTGRPLVAPSPVPSPVPAPLGSGCFFGNAIRKLWRKK
jgi:hypothetical protein